MSSSEVVGASGSVLTDYQARALYDYEAKSESELTLKVGQLVSVVEEFASGWFVVASGEQLGAVPGNYVERIVAPSSSSSSANPITPSTPSNPPLSPSSSASHGGALGVALYDFEGASSNELSFKAGARLLVTAQLDGGWWRGRLADVRSGPEAHFPQVYVRLDATGLSSSSSSAVSASGRRAKADSHKARALFDFNGATAAELSFKAGDLVSDVVCLDGEWWRGRANGKLGHFPHLYVELVPTRSSTTAAAPAAAAAAAAVATTTTTTAATATAAPAAEPVQPPPAKSDAAKSSKLHARAKFAYRGLTASELSFAAGDRISDVVCLDGEWWRGRFRGQLGHFPATWVELLPASLNSSSEVPASSPPPLSNSKRIAAAAAAAAAPASPPSTPASFRVRATKAYQAPDATHLSFAEGSEIVVVAERDDGLYRGVFQAKEGLFPKGHVVALATTAPADAAAAVVKLKKKKKSAEDSTRKKKLKKDSSKKRAKGGAAAGADDDDGGESESLPIADALPPTPKSPRTTTSPRPTATAVPAETVESLKAKIASLENTTQSLREEVRLLKQMRRQSIDNSAMTPRAAGEPAQVPASLRTTSSSSLAGLVAVARAAANDNGVRGEDNKASLFSNERALDSKLQVRIVDVERRLSEARNKQHTGKHAGLALEYSRLETAYYALRRRVDDAETALDVNSNDSLPPQERVKKNPFLSRDNKSLRTTRTLK